MANKKIIVSDGKGRYQETTSSFGIDDGILTVLSATIATASFSASMPGLLQVYNGKVVPVRLTSSIFSYYDTDNNPSTVYDGIDIGNLSGTLFQYRTDDGVGPDEYKGFGPHRIAQPIFTGDIVGTVSSSSPAKVISIQNVTGGVLKPMYGGTGQTSFSSGSMVTLSGSGFSVSDTQDKVITSDINGDWSVADKNSIDALAKYLTGTLVYLFTGSISETSASTSTQFLWKKPPGTRFITVMCQGGGSSGNNQNPSNVADVAGGGGGGYSEATFDGSTFPEDEITILAGNGGKPANRGKASSTNRPGAGGTSSFGSYIYADPGYSYFDGVGNSFGIPGVGYTYNGSPSTNTNAKNAYFGGAGGGFGSYYGGQLGGSITSLGLTSKAAPVSPTEGDKYYYYGYYLNSTESLSSTPFPKLICAGGAGSGDNGVDGTSPSFGSGGGGGYSMGSSVAPNSTGGAGGRGYVLIICS